jgi:putative PIN family toxin of toxin-antitoxin system
MRKQPQVVLDTNVVLSALVFSQGRLAPLRHAWQAKQFVLLISNATAKELVRVLAYPKFKLNAEEQKELLADYLPYCKIVRIPARLPKTPACSDPFDIPFLQLALVGKANYLVSGDSDLLSLKKCGSCRIVAAEEFLKLIEK